MKDYSKLRKLFSFSNIIYSNTNTLADTMIIFCMWICVPFSLSLALCSLVAPLNQMPNKCVGMLLFFSLSLAHIPLAYAAHTLTHSLCLFIAHTHITQFGRPCTTLPTKSTLAANWTCPVTFSVSLFFYRRFLFGCFGEFKYRQGHWIPLDMMCPMGCILWYIHSIAPQFRFGECTWFITLPLSIVTLATAFVFHSLTLSVSLSVCLSAFDVSGYRSELSNSNFAATCLIRDCECRPNKQKNK